MSQCTSGKIIKIFLKIKKNRTTTQKKVNMAGALSVQE
jgi:hypothetical protein